MNMGTTIMRRGDVFGGAYLGTQLNYEFPWYDWLVQLGVRAEYAYTWSDILQRATDMNEVNLMLNFGIRF